MTKGHRHDLGTTNSCVAVMEGNTHNGDREWEGARTTPSMSHSENAEVLVGQSANGRASPIRRTPSSPSSA